MDGKSTVLTWKHCAALCTLSISYNSTLFRICVDCTRTRLRKFSARTSRTTANPVLFFRRPITLLIRPRGGRCYEVGTRRRWKTRRICSMIVNNVHWHVVVMLFVFTNSCAKIKIHNYNKRETAGVIAGATHLCSNLWRKWSQTWS